MRSSLIARGVAATAAVLLMTACGGSSDDSASSTTTSAAPSSTAESSSEAPAADSEFCTQASQITDRITNSLSGGEGGLSESLQQVSGEMSAVEAPPEIADDWKTLAAALDKVAGALEGVDLTDPDEAAKAQAELGKLEAQLGDSGNKVEAYLRDQCGIDTEGTGTAPDSASAAPSS